MLLYQIVVVMITLQHQLVDQHILIIPLKPPAEGQANTTLSVREAQDYIYILQQIQRTL